MIRPGREIRELVLKMKSSHDLTMLECVLANCIDDEAYNLGGSITVTFERCAPDGINSISYIGANVVVSGVPYNIVGSLVRHIKRVFEDVGGYYITTYLDTIRTDYQSHIVMKISWE